MWRWYDFLFMFSPGSHPTLPSTVKIPELTKTVKNKRDLVFKMGKESVCCDEEICKEEEKRACTLDEKRKEETLLKAVENGLKGWMKALAIDAVGSTSTKSIVNWFTSDAIDPMPLPDKDNFLQALFNLDSTKDRLAISGQSAALAPNALIAGATKLDLDYGSKEADKGLGQTRRIQFSGGSGIYQMTMSKERSASYSANSCWLGCNVDIDGNVGGYIDFDGKLAGIRVAGKVGGGENVYNIGSFELVPDCFITNTRSTLCCEP